MTEQPIEWGFAQSAYPGAPEPGDRYFVQTHDKGVLVAVIDGLGHGPKAAVAAQAAVDHIQTQVGLPPQMIMESTHKVLRSTRGAVMSIANIDKETHRMTWLGVGNVTGVLLRQNQNGDERNREHLLVRGGVIGYRLPPLKTFTLDIELGDTLIFTTDGIRSGFQENLPPTQAPQAMADAILSEHARDTDDALAVVVRYQLG